MMQTLRRGRRTYLAFLLSGCGRALLVVVLSVVVVVAGATAAPNEQPSDVPSDVPSMMPIGGLESQLPTLVSTNEGGGRSNVSAIPWGSCSDVGQCTPFNTLPALANFVASIKGSKTLCLCPVVYSNENQACTTTLDEPSITVSSGQNVTIECDKKYGAKCIFACEPVALSVDSGGKLTLLGNGLMELTWGKTYSRLLIGTSGEATVRNVVFRDTKAGTAASSRRKIMSDSDRVLQGEANGLGGAINNGGTLTVEESTFRNCSAFLQGGAIYSSGNATILQSTFRYNQAQTGGAIYVTDGSSLTAQSNTFDGNIATVSGDDIGYSGNADVSECGNEGIDSSPACTSSSPSAIVRPYAAKTICTLLAVTLFFFEISRL